MNIKEGKNISIEKDKCNNIIINTKDFIKVFSDDLRIKEKTVNNKPFLFISFKNKDTRKTKIEQNSKYDYLYNLLEIKKGIIKNIYKNKIDLNLDHNYIQKNFLDEFIKVNENEEKKDFNESIKLVSKNFSFKQNDDGIFYIIDKDNIKNNTYKNSFDTIINYSSKPIILSEIENANYDKEVLTFHDLNGQKVKNIFSMGKGIYKISVNFRGKINYNTNLIKFGIKDSNFNTIIQTYIGGSNIDSEQVEKDIPLKNYKIPKNIITRQSLGGILNEFSISLNTLHNMSSNNKLYLFIDFGNKQNFNNQNTEQSILLEKDAISITLKCIINKK